MVTKAQKIRLGVFLVIGSLLILGFIATVAGNWLMQTRDIYYIEFDDYSVTGLQVGSAVNFRGIRVGRVEELSISPDDMTKIIITVSVESGTPVKEDCEAVLIHVGITGLKAVEIRGGTHQAKDLKPGSFIPTGVSVFDDITDRAVSIAVKIDEIATNIANLTNEENRMNIAAILSQTSQLLASTNQNLSTTLEDIGTLARSVALMTESTEQNMKILSDNLERNLNRITESTTQGIDAIAGSATANMDNLVAQTNAQFELMTRSLINELNTVSTNLNSGINDISAQTSALLSETRHHLGNIGNQTDQMLLNVSNQINDLSLNLNRSVSRINQLIDSPAFDSLLVNANTMAEQLAQANLTDLVQELTSATQRSKILIANLDRTLLRSRSNIVETLESLRETAENLSDFSRQIADNPAVLIRGN